MSKFIALMMTCLIYHSCIYTNRAESYSASTPEVHEDGWQTENVDGIRVESFVYRPSKYPLERFWDNLKDGELNRSLKEFDLTYSSANYSNEAIEKLIDSGFVPTYISIQNNSDKSIVVSESQLLLRTSAEQIESIASESVPSKFSEFNPKAVGANVFNTLVLVSTVVLILAASSGGAGSANLKNVGNKDVYNPTDKEVIIDYGDYLFHFGEIKPGEIRKGLLFFQLNKINVDWNDFSLSLAKTSL